MKGELVVVLNQLVNEAEALEFVKNVFAFPGYNLVVCNSNDSFKATIELANGIAYHQGRSFLSVPFFSDCVDLFRPERIVYINPAKTQPLNMAPLTTMIEDGKCVMVVFGVYPGRGEEQGLEVPLNTVGAAAAVLHRLFTELMNK